MNIIFPHAEQLHPRGRTWVEAFRKTLLPLGEEGDVRQQRLPQFQYTLQMLVGDKRVAINTREYDHFLEPGAAEFDLILNCQYDMCTVAGKKLKNVVPFMMFARQMVEFHQRVEEYREIVSSQEKKYDVGWTGCHWRCRQSMIEGLWKDAQKAYLRGTAWQVNNKNKSRTVRAFLRNNWTCTRRANRGDAGRQFIGSAYEDYLAEIGSWRWGLVLYGRGRRNGAGNQREHEFAALSIPMMLNYQPTYYEPFVAGKHYAFVEDAESVLKVAETNGSELSDNAREYWQRNMSAAGIRRLFLQILEDRL